MPFSFRRSKSFGPFRLTVSKRGLSTSVGAKGLRLTKGPSGTHATASAGGFRYRTRLDQTAKTRTRSQPPLRTTTPRVPKPVPPTRRALREPLAGAPAVVPPGWYPDPLHQADVRYWDGHSWTDRGGSVHG
jgi:Protein of unknown function (DUF4236)/Protein of unknown function (DUF2510)